MATGTTEQAIPADASARFRADGFYLAPPIVPRELIDRVIPHMDAVIAGEYETGIEPHARGYNNDDPTRLRKIDGAHPSDRTIYELITHPAIGRWAAAMTGARMVQVWATQLLYKPPTGESTGSVGWHQDRQYWPYFEGELFTAWIAVSDVTAESGPMRFLRGSQRWGFLNKGDFFSGDHDKQKEEIVPPGGERWDEAAAILPPGAASFHDCLTFHGSGPNYSNAPRRSFALHMRTERSRPTPGAENYYLDHLDDPTLSPVIFRSDT